MQYKVIQYNTSGVANSDLEQYLNDGWSIVRVDVASANKSYSSDIVYILSKPT